MTFWLAANMAWASAAMVLVLLLRRPFARLFGAGSAYALWLVPALRLVMPPLPAFAPDLPSLVPSRTMILFVGDAAAPLPPDGGPGQWVPLLLAIWAGGAAVLLAWQFLPYRRLLTELAFRREALAPIAASAWSRARRRRDRSLSAFSTAGSSSRPISTAAIRPRSAASRSIMTASIIGAATSGGTMSAFSSSPSTGSIRSPGWPSAPSGQIRSWPATPPSPPPPLPTRATIMRAP